MTTGNFAVIPIDSIWVDRENRQRKELEGIEELAESIRERGLINPVTITKDLQLIAGERRYEAHKLLGFDQIAVHFTDDLTEEEMHLIELEENIKRLDLTWQDEVDAVARFHSLRQQTETDWTQEKTAENLGMSPAYVSKQLLVKKYIDEGVKDVIEAPKLTTAANFASRLQERKKASVLRDLRQQSQSSSSESPSITESDLADIAPPTQSRFADILNENFQKWSKNVQEVPFNLIHCDFPYGVNAGDTKGQSGAKGYGGYEDKPEIYFDLINTLNKNLDNFVSPSAHMIFWFSMDFYTDTVQLLTDGGWYVNKFPLIWHKTDNTGILPDKSRGPRRIYETALLCTRGDRKIVKARGNCVGSVVTKKYHMSEKSTTMLEHFLSMLVDETTTFLDPTCGSGNAVKVAESLGADWALGLEINPEYVTLARENLELD